VTTACLLLFTKPARPGKVKTRLIPKLGAERAAALHEALLEDLLARLAGGCFDLRVAWALAPGEALPGRFADEVRQQGEGLGERLYGALAAAALEHRALAAIGSDHPELGAAHVEAAFARLAAGAEVVLGPAQDGGYYLIALAPGAVRRELFEGVPWSTSGVLAATLERCRQLGLRCELLGEGWDVDRPEDLDRLEHALAEGRLEGPVTRRLLASWRLAESEAR
jgi:hypothetical protein